jgi:hypothetical protein
MLEAALSIEGPDGQRLVLFKKGAAPGTARAVFGTQRAGERTLSFKLVEGEPAGARVVGTFAAALPPGLPPNTWLAVFITAGADHAVRAAVRENLRRLEIEPECDRTGADAIVYTIA